MKERDLNIGILGFGDRGVSFVAPILDNNIRNHITVIIDPDVSRAKFFLEDTCVSRGQIPADEAKRIRFIRDIDELAKGEIDALWLTASERVRTAVFPKAVATGAHIYSEKGLSNNMAGAKRIVSAMKGLKKGQKVFMGFNLRHYPALVAAKKILDEGRIGNILFVQYIEMMTYSHGGSFYMRFHRDVKNSGGMFVTKSCHDFDLMGHLISSRPARVFSAQYKRLFGRGGKEARSQCHTCDRTLECEWDRMRHLHGRAAKRRYAKIYLDDDKVTTDGYFRDLCCWRGDTELRDLSNVMFEYENGVPANYTQVLFSPSGNRIIKIFGDRGSLVFEEADRSITILDRWNARKDRIVSNPVRDSHGGSDTGVTAAFFRMVREGEKPTSTVEDGVWALATAEAAYRSARLERWVKVRPIAESTGI